MARLKHLTSVLYFAAHPDDENTRLLAWLVNEKNVRTGYMSLTRGDGGQNILGSEQGEALGLIRTHELMEARKLDGAEQYFSRAIDFGFSKTHEETSTHWGEYLLTSDAVWVMRKFRPDVVICRFPPNTQAGHGQHAMSAMIAASAFKKAGDKLQYTEQLHTYAAWQPKRILWNTYRFGDRNTTSESQFKLKVGQYQPGIGMGASELAGLSRSIHKSQGAGTPSVPGVQTEYFSLVDGHSLSKSLFDGIDITWGRVNRKDIDTNLRQIINDYDFTHPDASIPALLKLKSKILTVTDEYWRNEKLEEVNQVILDCAGILAELYTKQPQTVAGVSLPFTLHVIARSATPITLSSIKMGNMDTALNRTLQSDSLYSFDYSLAIPASTPVSQPYWLAQVKTSKDMFTIPNDSLIGLPETPCNLAMQLNLNIGGTSFTIPVPLSFKKLDPIKGDVVEQLRIVPDANVSFNSNLLVTRTDGSCDAEIAIHAYKELKNATLTLSGKTTVASLGNINMASGTDTTIIVALNQQLSAKQGTGDYYLSAELTNNGKTINQSLHLIQYSHLPVLQYFTPAYTKVLRANWKCAVKHIGFIEGAGDYALSFLRQAGLQVDVLKEGDMTDAGKLKKYDAIITGIRSVNVEKRMSAWLPVLLKYAENGGTLVMQYNTLQDMSTTKLGPFPFTIADKRVTEENASVTFADPKNKILNYPNKITSADFNDWVQERGLYFPVKWDEKYQPLFTMNDTGEDPLSGCTLYAKTGKGHYIYTSLSFFRQLPVGNKGAIRLLMNMLSVGK